jgi:acetyl/propionyl-CoA carboxylase alpha subunit
MIKRLSFSLLLAPSLALAQTATNYNYNTVTASTATSNNVNQNNNVSTSTSTNVNQNVNSGTVTNINQNTSDSTSSSTVDATNHNINTDTSVSTVTQNQTVNASNTNTSVSDSKSTSYSENVSRQVIDQNLKSPPPSAIAPSMMSYSQDLCTSGMSGAVQTQILGVSAGKTVHDTNCERLKLSKTLYDMGMRVAAVSLLCQDKRVFDAMWEAGTPCPFDGVIGDKAKSAWGNAPEKKPKK